MEHHQVLSHEPHERRAFVGKMNYNKRAQRSWFCDRYLVAAGATRCNDLDHKPNVINANCIRGYVNYVVGTDERRGLDRCDHLRTIIGSRRF